VKDCLGCPKNKNIKRCRIKKYRRDLYVIPPAPICTMAWLRPRLIHWARDQRKIAAADRVPANKLSEAKQVQIVEVDKHRTPQNSAAMRVS